MSKVFDREFFNFLSAFIVILITSFTIVIASANIRAGESEVIAADPCSVGNCTHVQ